MDNKERQSLEKAAKRMESALAELHNFIYTPTAVTKDKSQLLDPKTIAYRGEQAAKIMSKLYQVHGSLLYFSEDER